MDAILKALGHPVRIRILQLLLEGGPATQDELRSRVEALEGTMSKQLRPLLLEDIVEKDSYYGRCRVAHPDETLDILRAASRLNELVALRRVERASAEAARMQDLRPHPGE